MIIMQIAQTETLPTDENIFIGLSGLPKKRYALQLTKKLILQVSAADFTYLFTIVDFFF